jgi:RNA polymerase sigma factor (sigma-70 family)
MRAAGERKFANLRAFRAWLLAILRNTVTQHGRRQRRREAENPSFSSLPDRAVGASTIVERRDGAAKILAFVKRLPERERRVILLRLVNDLSFAEIGAQVGITEAHARVLFNRTLAELRHRANPSTSAEPLP